uniref:Phosphatidic acid phosphatase putative n=1 Tax=Albugo laibachii Nc14 TaxID=890382 RepID=F0WJM0_9STRA|nr:phosphatidic acid phosphatase putative [Albugo laibachii Nc14]|eukprot:CCA21469.1 phosphatidic acid phosphatase putative [Albugo laibachii Nc14]
MSKWKEHLYALDLRVARDIYQRSVNNNHLRLLWETISYTGDGILWILTVLPALSIAWILGFLDKMEQTTKMSIFDFYICILVDLIVIFILKISIKRQRPPHHKTDARFVGPDQHSFPSGHATRALCLTGFIFDYSTRRPALIQSMFYTEPSWICIFAGAWAFLICYSRIALGRHYPSDVVIGAFVGFLLEYPIAYHAMQHLTVI